MEFIDISPKQLRQAAELQERIQSLREQLRALLGATEQGQASVASATGGAKRQISAAGLERIRAAQKARWARAKGTSQAAKTAGTSLKPRRVMSAAAKARLSALAKARWKKAKKAGKTTL